MSATTSTTTTTTAIATPPTTNQLTTGESQGAGIGHRASAIEGKRRLEVKKKTVWGRSKERRVVLCGLAPRLGRSKDQFVWHIAPIAIAERRSRQVIVAVVVGGRACGALSRASCRRSYVHFEVDFVSVT